MTKRILVIEDNAKHLADAKAFFADKPEYQVDYVKNLSSPFWYKKQCQLKWPEKEGVFPYDGVITDLMFPFDETYTEEVPAGFGVLIFLRDYKVPCVINTAGGTHGQKTHWVFAFCRDMGLLRDHCAIAGVRGDDNGEAPSKEWLGALNLLNRQMDKPKS